MKVILLSPLPPPAGGIASWTKRILTLDWGKGNEVCIVNTAVIGKRIEQLVKRHIFDEIKRSVKIYKDLKSKLKSFKPDIIHVNTSCGKYGLIRDYALAKLAKKHNVKLLLYFHCDISYQVSNILTRFFFKKIANNVDMILVLNKASKEYTKKIAGKNSIIFPNFILKENVPSLAEEKNINKEIQKILYVGHVTKAKGSDVIFKVAERFPNISFSLYGYISKEIACLPKPDNVFLHGEVAPQKVVDAFNESDVFLFPTLTEGFPMALLEAMAHGMPCITTSAGAIPDMLEQSGGIIIEKIGDVNGFSGAVTKLNKDIKLRKKMSAWNKNKVNKYYTQDIVFKRMLKIYIDVIKTK